MDHSYDEEKDAVVNEANRGQVADAVEGRKEAEEDIAAAEKAADEELVHLDQPENVIEKEADKVFEKPDDFRNPPHFID